MNGYLLTAAAHAQVLDALKDALCELESDGVAELVSQRLVNKIEQAIKVLQND